MILPVSWPNMTLERDQRRASTEEQRALKANFTGKNYFLGPIIKMASWQM